MRNGDSHILDKHWGVHCIDPRTLDPRIMISINLRLRTVDIDRRKRNETRPIVICIGDKSWKKLYSHLNLSRRLTWQIGIQSGQFSIKTIRSYGLLNFAPNTTAL